MRSDVIVAGAGPAGVLAATVLARAGAQVRLFDRARFPRPKLCGDTLNPGAMSTLAAHLSTAEIERQGLALDGMLLTGEHVEVQGTYPRGLKARALTRHTLDALLLGHALAAGVHFDEGVVVQGPVVNDDGRIAGVRIAAGSDRSCTVRARLVIAADGRESRLARALGLARHPGHPRRWAVGGYFEGVHGVQTRGEMHVRAGRYIGVAPVPGGLTNTCVVLPQGARGNWRDPAALLVDVVRADRRLAPRFADARLVEPPRVLGPLAVDATSGGVPGLLLAGDAAGFIDPMTGDGLRLALVGAVLAAGVAGEVLDGRVGAGEAVRRLEARRRRAFAAKWRFNRTMRLLVSRPPAVTAAAITARLLPALFAALIRYAGDCQTA